MRQIDDLVDRIRTSHPSAKITRQDPGIKVEMSSEEIFLESAIGGSKESPWRVFWAGTSEDFPSIKDAGYAVLDFLNKIYTIDEARRPARGSSSTGGGRSGLNPAQVSWR